MRKLATLLMLMMPTAADAGTVQCECPEVSAKGTGDTSCSATETGNECTVDFNTFGFEDENAAFDFLANNSSSAVKFRFLDRLEFPGGLNPSVASTFFRDPQELVDLLVIYILVSGVQADSAPPGGLIREIHDAMRQNADIVANAFLRDGFETFSSSNAVAKVSHGCLEISANDGQYWGMFKAFWSRNAAAPQCGPF